MLVIRLSRAGRKNLAIFRVVVQDKRRHPQSGKVVKHLGSYNPHTKELKVDEAETKRFINSGAQPSRRVVRLLQDAGFKLPAWAPKLKPLKAKVKHPEKLRRNQTDKSSDNKSDNGKSESDAPKPQADKAGDIAESNDKAAKTEAESKAATQ